MNMPSQTDSPFHVGEQALQARTGKREKIEALGRRVIRNFLPDQHRAFFARLPFLVVGSVDESGLPWATLLSGPPGFAQSPDPQHLTIQAEPDSGDPATPGLQAGRAVGLLGIELPTRRRNRMNGRIAERSAAGLTVRVDQAFGNCPQYIHARAVEAVDRLGTSRVERLIGLPGEAAAFIASADTFFVASYVPDDLQPDIEGVDVSHRGGQPGFVRVDGDVLTIPDFRGNKHFNTLGNFYQNPRAGLVFPDFKTGDLLQLTGSVELLDEDHPEVKSFRGAERAWRVTVETGNWLRQTLPLRFVDGEASPQNATTDTWASAEARVPRGQLCR